jgi:uncharacterized protein
VTESPTPRALTWQQRADDALVVRMPSRLRISVEVALLVVLVLGGHIAASSVSLGLAILAIETVVAIGLVRPWAASHPSFPSRVVVTLVALATVVVPVLVQAPDGTTRRLGVELIPAVPDTATSRSTSPAYAEVRVVAPKTPAEGQLRAADRIRAVDGVPLAGNDPPADLARRIQAESLPDDIALSVERDGEVREIPIHVPRVTSLTQHLGAVNSLARRHVIVATAVRDLVFILFLLVLLRVDGQPLTAIGIAREGARGEIAMAIPAIGGIFLVQIAAAIPLAIMGTLFGVGSQEASERIDTLSHLSAQTSVPEFLVSLVIAAIFEEIAFRAFLTPRVRVLSGSWVIAGLAVSAIFGLGHGYEGTLAIAQTAILGIYFTTVFLARRRLLSVVLCHATFNALMFVFVRVIASSGVLEHLKALTPH